MSWHFSQALEAEYSAGSCSDGAQSAPSSGTGMHGTFWSPGKTTDVLNPSRSGMTFKPLTDTHGEAVLMSYLEASRARTSLPLEKVPGSKASEAVCGSTWRESSVKYCRNSSSWKTHQCLWEEDLAPSSLILPRWGMMQGGVLWERTTPEHLTSETESGSSLNWPTPQARDWKGSSGRSLKGMELDLPTAVKKWPTPTVNDSHNCTMPPSQLTRDNLPGAMLREGEKPNGGHLNPTWVEWLMGWPLGWTDCAVSATDKFRQWLNSHGKH